MAKKKYISKHTGRKIDEAVDLVGTLKTDLLESIPSISNKINSILEKSKANRAYKIYPITEIKVNDVMKTMYTNFGFGEFNLTEYEVVGEFNEDLSKFKGFCLDYAIPAGYDPNIPDGITFSFPLPGITNTENGNAAKYPIDETFIASLYSCMEWPFSYGGACEIYYGEIDMAKSIAIIGSIPEAKKVREIECYFNIVDSFQRKYSGFMPNFDTNIFPEASMLSDKLARIGHTIILTGDDGSLSLGNKTFSNANTYYDEPHYEIFVDAEKYVTFLYDIEILDINNVYQVYLADAEYFSKWAKKHTIFSCRTGNNGDYSYFGLMSGDKGVLPLIVIGKKED